jgi:hypothetical protein
MLFYPCTHASVILYFRVVFRLTPLTDPLTEIRMPNPLTQPLSTPINSYGIVEVSRPMAAALLGFSLKALNRRLREGQLTTSGRVKKMIPLADIERITGRPVSVHSFLSAMATKPRNPRRMDGRRDQPEYKQCKLSPASLNS